MKPSVEYIFYTIAIVSITYLLFIHAANRVNKTIAENAEMAIINIINNGNTIDFQFPEKKEKFKEKIIVVLKKLKNGINWSWIFQSIFIACMAIGSIKILSL